MISYETIEIDHYREPVTLWDGPWMSYRIKGSNDEILNWIWGINGFQEYQWGYVYEIRVKRKIILDPPLDAPSSEYSFIKVISKEKAYTEARFTLMLKEGRDIYYSRENGRHRLLNEIDFFISESVIKENLEACIPISRSIKGTFSHLNEKALLLHEIEYDFDRDLAMEFMFSLPDLQLPPEVEEWNESDFISYMKNNIISTR